jgi:phosphoribosylformylglycinamidine synthase
MDIFRKWDLDAVVIGRVREGERMIVLHEGETVADIPVSLLTDEAPKYERQMTAPVSSSELHVSSFQGATLEVASGDQKRNETTHSELETRNSKLSDLALTKLLASPNLASKQWVYRQYDHMVRTNTAVLPGADAAVVRIKETRRALAMTLDGNGRYCAANPREGAKLIVAEAARNVVCVGARPIAITNCLNFASPERPDVMWSFSEVIDGMAEACTVFNTPVVSGNVSFYNETEGRGILPTPVIGMLGLVEDVRRVLQLGFKQEGDLIALLGATADDLTVSEYAATVLGQSVRDIIGTGKVPQIDLQLERAVQQTCLEAAEAGLLQSAHDCSDGGLAVALAESCFSSLNREALGADLDLTAELRVESLLFSESPSRIILSFTAAQHDAVAAIADRHKVPFALLGKVGGPNLVIRVNDETKIDQPVAELENGWRNALPEKLEAQAMAAGRE